MSPLSPDIFAFAARFRAQLSPADGVEELLVDGLVATAVRLKRLYADPAAVEPYGVPEWDRAHDLASRAFFRHYDRLERRRRAAAKLAATARPARPLPAALELDRPAPVPARMPTPAPEQFLPFSGLALDDECINSPAEPVSPPIVAPTTDLQTEHEAAATAINPPSILSPRRRPDPERLLRRERERRKRERQEQRRTPNAHPLAVPARSPARASPAA